MRIFQNHVTSEGRTPVEPSLKRVSVGSGVCMDAKGGGPSITLGDMVESSPKALMDDEDEELMGCGS